MSEKKTFDKKLLAQRCGIIAVLFLVLGIYIGVAAIFQIGFRLPPVVSTAVSNSFITVLCCTAYIIFKKKGIFTEDKRDMFIKEYSISFGTIIVFDFCTAVLFTWVLLMFPDSYMENRVASIAESDVLIYTILSCTLTPITEEFMMRLFLYNLFKTKFKWTTSMIVTSVVFAFLHGTMTHLFVATIFGAFLVLVYEHTGRWYMPVVAHAIYNTICATCSYVVSEFGKALPAAIICMLFAVIILLYYMITPVKKYENLIKPKKPRKRIR